MLWGKPFRLITLGRLALVQPDGKEHEQLGKRRHKLAVLAVLAVSGRPMSRDALLEMFWGEQDEARARHSLSNALSSLRSTLGGDAISMRQAEAALAPDAPLVVDAHEFTAAVEARDFSPAIALYGGPFLDAVYVAGSARFQLWADRERHRLETLFLRSCDQQCMALARTRRWDECAAVAERWLDAAPLSADAALYLMNALKAPGGREADRRALDAYERLRDRLSRELDAAPDPPVATLAASIADRVAVVDVTPAALVAAGGDRGASPALPVVAIDAPALSPTPDRDTGPRPARDAPPSARRWAGRRWAAAISTLVVGTVALFGLLLAGAARHPATPQPVGEPASRPSIAVTSFRITSGDTAFAWLADGFPQMIAAKLARTEGIDVVAPTQVRAVELRAGYDSAAAITDGQARDLGRRVGATLVVVGQLARERDALVLSLAVQDVASGRVLHGDALSSPDVLSLADEAAARVLAAARAEGPGMRLADLETSSVDAFEHFGRYLRAAYEGRISRAGTELDAAIAIDSGFVSALQARLLIAIAGNEDDVVRRLQDAIERHGARATQYDRLEREAFLAFYDGEHARSEALAQTLVRRYPRDPRAYAMLVNILENHGRWDAAEEVEREAIARDSVAIGAGSGPCTPCVGYGSLATLRLIRGDREGAERAAQHWLSLQPVVPGAWAMLAMVLGSTERYDAAVSAMRRAISLSGEDPQALDRLARLLIAARRYGEADSVIRAWDASPSEEVRTLALDLRAMLQRERGQLRASNRTIASAIARYPQLSFLELVSGNTLGRLGEYAAAARVYERITHGTRDRPLPLSMPKSARAFCWHHALEADAIAGSGLTPGSGDTLLLAALADSLQALCGRSYFARDWRLHHHVRGLLAARAGRYEQAVREFQAARWGLLGWSRSTVEQARALLALDQPLTAVAVLRDAYASPPDAMGRYEPRSGIDYLMARAFRQAGMTDSAAVYAGYARRAWKDADPEVHRLLGALR